MSYAIRYYRNGEFCSLDMPPYPEFWQAHANARTEIDAGNYDRAEISQNGAVTHILLPMNYRPCGNCGHMLGALLTVDSENGDYRYCSMCGRMNREPV